MRWLILLCLVGCTQSEPDYLVNARQQLRISRESGSAASVPPSDKSSTAGSDFVGDEISGEVADLRDEVARLQAELEQRDKCQCCKCENCPADCESSEHRQASGNRQLTLTMISPGWFHCGSCETWKRTRLEETEKALGTTVEFLTVRTPIPSGFVNERGNQLRIQAFPGFFIHDSEPNEDGKRVVRASFSGPPSLRQFREAWDE